MHSHFVLTSFLYDVYAFHKKKFCSCFHLFLELHTSSTLPQFATCSCLFWMPCYDCKQRTTVFGLHTYSKILFFWILLKCWGIKGIRFGRVYLIFCVASTFCSSHTDQMRGNYKYLDWEQLLDCCATSQIWSKIVNISGKSMDATF